MSVIFQLFSADDLKGLNMRQMNELKEMIGKIQSSPKVLEAVKVRADEVFKQLKGHDPTEGLPPSPEQAGMLVHLFHEPDLADLSEEEKTIIEWAVICEVTHNEAALLAIRKQADILFSRHKPEAALPNSDIGYHITTPRP